MTSDASALFPIIPRTTDLDEAVALVVQRGVTRTAELDAFATKLVGASGVIAAASIPATSLAAPRWGSFTQTINAEDFADGGAAIGVMTMTGVIPAGALLFNTKVLVPAGFSGNVSCTLQIGDGSDVDRYTTGTPSVFATAATGVEVALVSGAKLQLAAVSPVVTITSSTDITLVIADGSGQMVVTISYLIPN